VPGLVVRISSSCHSASERKTPMTRLLTSVALALTLLSGCASLSQTSRASNDDLLYGIGAISGMPGTAIRGPLTGPGWEGTY
jgi:hypothetical protein